MARECQARPWHFSGTATYETTATLPKATSSDARIVLDLGEVRDMAEVEVDGVNFNGQPLF